MFLKSRQIVSNNGASLEIIEAVSLPGFGHAVDLPGYFHLVVLVDTDQHYHYYQYYDPKTVQWQSRLNNYNTKSQKLNGNQQIVLADLGLAQYHLVF